MAVGSRNTGHGRKVPTGCDIPTADEHVYPVSAGTTASQKSSLRPVEPLITPPNSGLPSASMSITNRNWPGFRAIALPSGPYAVAFRPSSRPSAVSRPRPRRKPAGSLRIRYR